MRRLALAALLALAASACSVKTEGAACNGPSQCPDGQACGYDGKCSKEAVGCGAICRADDCDGSGGAPRRCEVAPNGICASFTALASCAGQNACLVSSRVADCVSLAITAPPAATVIAPAGASRTVTATLTATAAGFPAPAALTLTAGSSAGTLTLQGTNGAVSTYSGTYAPGGGVESVVELRASAGSVTSPPQPVVVDTRPPEIGTPSASCSGAPAVPCARDGLVDVAVSVTEANPGSVLAAVDLDYAATTPLADGGGGSYAGQLALGTRPFPGFSRPVTVRVTATDLHGNATTTLHEAVVAGGNVTRARPAYAPTSNPITSPAVLANGNAVVGIGSTAAPAPGAADQLRAVAPNGAEAWKQTLAVATGQGHPVMVAPAAGETSLFSASTDGRIYFVNADGSLPTGTFHMPTAANLGQGVEGLQSPWLRTVSSVDHAFTAIATNNNTTAPRLYQLWSDGSTAAAASGEVAAASGIWIGARTLVVTGTAGATLRRFVDDGLVTADGALALTDGASVPTACDRVSFPLAGDGGGFVAASCDNGQLHRVDATAATLAAGYLGNLGAAPSGSPVVLASGDYLVPLASGAIALVANPATAGSFTRDTFATLPAGDVARGLAVAAANSTTGAPATAYAAAFNAGAATSALHAFDLASGALLWSAPLGTSALDFPTIAPATAAPGALPTLLVGSGEGKLFRVVVDAPLDASAPWPKAHHDLRNTGNAATPVNGP